jgi:hypothetical protein
MKFSDQAIPANDLRQLSGKYPGFDKSKKPNDKAAYPAMPEFGCQDSQLVTYRIRPHHAGLHVSAEHTGTSAGRSARRN